MYKSDYMSYFPRKVEYYFNDKENTILLPVNMNENSHYKSEDIGVEI